jgi:6-pyruvoyltetrahydropterin/6-carboxytetrahydropterin synthase
MQPLGDYRVSVTKDYLIFAAAHFITFAGHRCESLHGHNYRAGVVLEGTLEPESWYVFDFVALKKIMRALCNEIDHKVLLPLENPRLRIAERGDSITVAYDEKPRYLFPTVDCALLPVPNTTVEMLARHLAQRLHAKLREASDQASRLTAIELEVEESVGQSAVYRMQLGVAAAAGSDRMSARSRVTRSHPLTAENSAGS